MRDRDPFTVKMMMNNLRDHYDMDYRKPIQYDIATSKMPTICCHPGGMNGCASAASVVCSLDKNAAGSFQDHILGKYGTSVLFGFTPKFNLGWIPQQLTVADAEYDSASPWWIFTELERYISLSYERLCTYGAGSISAYGGRIYPAGRGGKERIMMATMKSSGSLSQEAFDRSIAAARDLDVENQRLSFRHTRDKLSYA